MVRQSLAIIPPTALELTQIILLVETGYSYPNFAQWSNGTRTLALATATAVSVDATMSLPLTAGQSGSLFVAGNYATGAATIGATAAGTSLGGSVAPTAPAVTTAASSSASASASKKASSAQRPASVGTGSVWGLLVALGGMAVGAMVL